MFTSKYAILLLVNIPILAVGVVGAVTDYKTRRISRQRCVIQVIMWLLIGATFVFIEPVYNSLIRHHLTASAPMSIFDVALLTGLTLCILLIKQANERIANLNKKVARLHENQVIAAARSGNGRP